MREENVSKDIEVQSRPKLRDAEAKATDTPQRVIPKRDAQCDKRMGRARGTAST